MASLTNPSAISNSAWSPRCSSISSVAAVGESIPKFFQTITTDCHLKHPAVHQTTALVVLTMIRFLAYTLSLVFYQRQICSHARGKCPTFHECAQRMAYWFSALNSNTS
jgi:hypothetical protein